MQTVFVTGGTGFIGSHLIKLLLDKGYRVFALRRQGSTPRILLKTQPQWIEGDFNDDFRSIFSCCNSFVHLAAYGVSANSDDWHGCLINNVNGPVDLWLQAISCNIKNFLIVGSCFEYGLSSNQFNFIPPTAPLEPTTAYAFSKAAASVAAYSLSIRYKLSSLIVRPISCLW